MKPWILQGVLVRGDEFGEDVERMWGGRMRGDGDWGSRRELRGKIYLFQLNIVYERRKTKRSYK